MFLSKNRKNNNSTTTSSSDMLKLNSLLPQRAFCTSSLSRGFWILFIHFSRGLKIEIVDQINIYMKP